MNVYEERLREALPWVRDRLAGAADRAGRVPEGVRIVAVTKGHAFEAIEAALAAGLSDLGENRVEELEEKVARWRGDAGGPDGAGTGPTPRWHMIGRLQRRKAPRVRGLADLVHSVDSLELAERMDRSAPEGAGPLRMLVQVNTSGEESKTGLTPGNAIEAIAAITRLSSLRVEGLMTMAPLTEDERVLRDTFRRLRELHEEAGRADVGYRGSELSMGMSNDYEIAVEEGSTMVRLGTVLFGERPA
jgi:pyridoxal phosphate enzyme (YggS family)